MREAEASLQESGEFVLRARLVKDRAAPHCVRWVRAFLARPASDGPLAEQALRIDFVNFLHRTDWHRRPASAVVDEQGRASPLAALAQLRQRIRTRHYSHRTECSYADWVRRFFAYLAERQGVPHPRVRADDVRDFLAHLALHRRVSASTQNQAFGAILFLCREVLGIEAEGLSPGERAKRGTHLPVVLSMPETAALLDAMRGTTRLMAALIYGGGLRVSECCELRVKDVDFDQGLLFIRGGKGAKDRSTLLAEACRDELRAHLRAVEARHRSDRASGLAGAVPRRAPWTSSERAGGRSWPPFDRRADRRAGRPRGRASKKTARRSARQSAASTSSMIFFEPRTPSLCSSNSTAK